ncbi:MAG: diguanylate cyclase, partial [Thermoanaerobaculia bacterium]|nr:diguanylate cyclase [Thermoanaerobaculia bacterium]
MNPLNILVVDDEEAICSMLARMLEIYGYQVVIETDARNVLGLLRSFEFDVILLDLHMPHQDGMVLLGQIRKEFSVLPVLVVTGYGTVDTTVEAMRSGATDFISKPVDAPLLDIRIRCAYDLERARRLANTDGLTGLYNHRHFHERLQQEIERAERYRRALALIMVDLDHFKAYNDTYGHPRGDEVLIEVSRLLRQASRTTDIAARYGGEEFSLILPETTRTDARRVADRIRHCVEELRF